MRTHLRALAIWDALTLLCAILYYSLDAVLLGRMRLLRSPPPLPPFRLQPCPALPCSWLQWLTHGPSMMVLVGSVWTLVLIAWERHAAVANPAIDLSPSATSRHPFTLTTPLIALAARPPPPFPLGRKDEEGLAVLYSLPTFWELALWECKGGGGDPLYAISGTELRRSQLYNLFYRVLVHGIATSIGPFALIATLSFAIIRKVFLPRFFPGDSQKCPRFRSDACKMWRKRVVKRTSFGIGGSETRSGS